MEIDPNKSVTTELDRIGWSKGTLDKLIKTRLPSSKGKLKGMYFKKEYTE